MSADRPNTADDLRHRAEALLARSPGTFQPADIESVAALVHELAVHQAELELQNEELRSTQAALQQTRDGLATLFEHAPVGYVVLDAAGIIRRTNATWGAMLGRSGDDFRGTPFVEALVEEDAPVFLSRFRALLRNPAEKQIVVRIKRRDALPFDARIEAKPHAGASPELLVIVSDISDLQQARREIENRNAELGRTNDRLEHIYRVLLGIRNVNQLIVSENDPVRLIERSCVNLTETMGYPNTWIALLGGEPARALDLPDRGAVTAVAAAGFDAGHGALRERLEHGAFPTCMTRALASGDTVVIGDPVPDCPDCPLSGEYGGRAALVRRLAFDGVTYGVLTASVPAAYAENIEEQDLFNEVAGDLAFALHKISAARRLRESEERHRRLFETMIQGVVYQDRRGAIVSANPAAERILGLTSDQMTGRTSHDPRWHAVREDGSAFPGDEHPAMIALRTGEEVTDVVMGVFDPASDGYRWININAIPLFREGEQEPYQVYGSFEDITERRRAAETLRESEARFQRMLGLVPDMISIHDPDMNILYSNWNGFAAVPAEKRRLHTKCYRTYRGYDGICPDCQAKTVIETRNPFRTEIQLPDATWFDVRVLPLLDESGDVEAFVEWVRDITDWKRTEAALTRQLRFERAVAAASKRLLSAGNVEAAVTAALTPLLEASGVSRVYIFENFDDPADGLCTKQIVEVCAPGVPPEIDNPILQHVVYARGFEHWRKTLSAGNAIRGDVRGFPDNEREVLEVQGILSILILPLVVDGRWWGFIGFDETREARDWLDMEVTLLGTAAEMIGTFFTRRRTEDALSRERRRLGLVIEGSRMGCWEWNVQTNETVFNEQWAAMLGYTLDELTPYDYETWERLVHPDDLPTARAALTNCIEERAPEYDCELRMRHKTGRWIWILDRGCVMTRDAENRPLSMFGTHTDITQIKAVEEALKASEMRLREAIRAANVGLWDRDLTTNRVHFSREWKAQIGYAENEIGDRFDEWRDRVHPEDLAATLARIDRAIAEKQAAYHVEFRFRHKDGSYRWILSQGSVLRDEAGRAVRILGSHIDVSEQKAREEHFSLMGRMLDLAPAAITIHDTEGRFVFANAATLALHGYESKDEFLKIVLHDLDVPESAALLAERFRRIAEEGEAHFEVEHYRRDGSTFPLEVQAKQIEWEGRPAILSIASDISERKGAETRLRERTDLLQHITNHMFDLVAITDLEGVFTYAGPSHRILGFEPEQLVGTSVFDYVHPDDIAYIADEFKKFMTRPSPDSTRTVEYRQRCKDGSYLWLETKGKILFADHGTPCALFFSSRDVTGRRQAEKERESLRNQLVQAQKMESIGRLAGGVAHDFNNMLNVILGHTEMMLDGLGADSPLRAGLEEVRKAAERSANLTRQLLAFARKQTVAPKVLDLNDTVAAMLKMLQRLIGEDIDLLWKPGSGLSPVRIDPGQVDQMLANLAVNSRDAIGPAIGKVTIETANARFDEEYCAVHAGFAPGDYVMLAVSDDGCGMDEATRSQIFEPFFTTKETGQGTGLGLSMVYGIVKQNNGFINVYSEPGQGTTLKIYLPRHTAAAAARPEKRPGRPGERGRETILLVEDEPAILSMTTLMLERDGYTVVAAGTPGEAIRLATEHPGDIHLLISDVVMPEMNGRDLAKNILALYPAVKCLFMSGYTANVIAHHGVLDEGVNFIQKPYSKSDLATCVREVLDRD